MQIQNNTTSPYFGIKFTDNKDVRKVIKYAINNKCEKTLGDAFHNIDMIEGKNPITLKIDESIPNAFFMYGKRGVPIHFGETKDAILAALDGIIELSFNKGMQKSLFGTREIKSNISAENIATNYLV